MTSASRSSAPTAPSSRRPSRSANLSKSLKRKLSYTTTKTSVTLVIKGVRTGDEHARKSWVSRITQGLDRRKVKPLGALV